MVTGGGGGGGDLYTWYFGCSELRDVLCCAVEGIYIYIYIYIYIDECVR